MTEAVIYTNQLPEIRREQLRQLKDRYAGIAGNEINYIATLVEGYLHQDKQAVAAARALAFSNMFSTIKEHRTAETQGVDGYTLQWEQTASGPKLKSQFGYMDDLFAETMQSAQLDGFAFEVPRNQRNQDFYRQLKAKRAAGYDGPMLELSPHPEMTEAARARGYEGNDTIFVYTNSDGTETVRQYWMRGLSRDAYRPLLTALLQEQGHDKQLPSELSDLAIMDCSGPVSPDLLADVITFADRHKLNQDFPEELRPELQRYILQDVQQEARLHILPLIERQAETITSSGVFDIQPEVLHEIAGKIAIQQRRIDAYKDYLLGNVADADTFDRLSERQQLQQLRDEDFIMRGCGVSFAAARQEGKLGYLPTIEISSGSILRLSDEAECPSCGWCFSVKNGDPSTYEVFCPSPFACPDRSAVSC